jgi:hypothetical protein
MIALDERVPESGISIHVKYATYEAEHTPNSDNEWYYWCTRCVSSHGNEVTAATMTSIYYGTHLWWP